MDGMAEQCQLRVWECFGVSASTCTPQQLERTHCCWVHLGTVLSKAVATRVRIQGGVLMLQGTIVSTSSLLPCCMLTNVCSPTQRLKRCDHRTCMLLPTLVKNVCMDTVAWAALLTSWMLQCGKRHIASMTCVFHCFRLTTCTELMSTNQMARRGGGGCPRCPRTLEDLKLTRNRHDSNLPHLPGLRSLILELEGFKTEGGVRGRRCWSFSSKMLKSVGFFDCGYGIFFGRRCSSVFMSSMLV